MVVVAIVINIVVVDVDVVIATIDIAIQSIGGEIFAGVVIGNGTFRNGSIGSSSGWTRGENRGRSWSRSRGQESVS